MKTFNFSYCFKFYFIFTLFFSLNSKNSQSAGINEKEKLVNRHFYFTEEMMILTHQFYDSCSLDITQKNIKTEKCIELIERLKKLNEEVTSLEKIIEKKQSFLPATQTLIDFDLESINTTQEESKHNSSFMKEEALLWEENKKMSTEDFLKKYELELNSYGVQLSFQNKTLLDSFGNQYPLIEWDSDLEKWLSMVSGNYKKSKAIADAFYEFIYPKTYRNPDITKDFTWFIFKYYNYIGVNPKYFKYRLSLYTHLTNFFDSIDQSKSLEDFLKKISQSFLHQENKKNPDQHKVAIVTGNYGNGHLSVAQSIESFLKHSNNIEVKIINECTQLPDALATVTQNQLRGCETFHDFTYKESNERKATLLNILNFKLGEYLLPNHFESLFDWIQDFKPDKIISTVHHIDSISALAYETLIPVSIVITDFEFPEKQWFHLNHVDPELIQYLFSGSDKNFFRRMVFNYSRNYWDTQIPRTRTNQIDQKLFQDEKNNIFHDVTESTGVLKYVEFPTPQSIHLPSSEENILKERESLDLSLRKERKIVTISFGGSSNSTEIVSLLNKIISQSSTILHPIQLVVLSGGNPQVIEEVSLLFQKNQIETENSIDLKDLSKNITGKILNRLSYPDEMARLYRATDVFVSKSGGATTSELIHSQTYFMRGFKLWPWEIANTQYLESVGLAIPPPKGSNSHDQKSFYSEDLPAEDISFQLNSLISRPRRLNKRSDALSSHLNDYKNKLANRMSELVKVFSIDSLAARIQINEMSRADKKEMIFAYLKRFRRELSPLDHQLEFKFNQFLRTVDFMIPEINLFKYFRNSGMRNIPTVAGIQLIIDQITQLGGASLCQEPVAVLDVTELESKLNELEEKKFIGQKSFLVYHTWSHFTALFLDRKDQQTRLLISDSVNSANEYYWIENIKKHIKKSKLIINDIFYFEKGRQSDLLSCFAMGIRDIIEHSESNLFDYLQCLTQNHSELIEKDSTDACAAHWKVKKHPEAFMKSSQSVSLLHEYISNNRSDIEKQKLEGFLKQHLEDGLVNGSVKKVNFYIRKKAFKYIEMILKRIIF